MRKTRHNKGFTMAEMLIVVAIIIILAGFGFVGISRYQRSLHQLEMDSIAKEIFIAAQNHLTMADSQGLLKKEFKTDSSLVGTKEEEDKDIFYFVVGGDGTYPGNSSNKVLDLMLPFASLDETVRLGGSYIIRYQFDSAKVLDVFYANKTGRFAYNFDVLRAENYNSLLANYRNGKKQERLKYNDGKSVIGWYGGEEADTLTRGAELKVPTIEVINAERLLVKVSNPNSAITDAGLRLVITGKTSQAKKAIVLDSITSVVEYTLDDVTSSGDHFYTKFCNSSDLNVKNLISGEDITVQVISYNNNQLTNIAYSSEVTTNSLFASVTTDAGVNTAKIANIRHLENLSKAISGFDSTSLSISKAQQIADLKWDGFTSAIKQQKHATVVNVYAKFKASPTDPDITTDTDCYLPVDLPNSFTYDGDGHKIMNVQVNHDGPAGIFGSLKDCNLSKVLVYNDVADDSALSISSKDTTGGPAGGLVGVMNGGSIDCCAAAVYVNAINGDAGGLVGKTTGTVNISNSYVGGHTYMGKYEVHADTPKVNTNVVSNNGNAGGLVGNGDGTLTVTNCYSTASAKGGASVGGLIGTLNGGTIENSYATGLVAGVNENTSKGAFIGLGIPTLTENYYYSMVNGDLKAVNQTTDETVTNVDVDGISAFDADASSYNNFVPLKQDARSNTASPYDATLTTNYPDHQYTFKTIRELEPEVPDWMSKHYGDWPSMETLVINEKNAPATP